MAKRKADVLDRDVADDHSKKSRQDPTLPTAQEQPDLLADSGSEGHSESESVDGGVSLDEASFKINKEFAARFEHNKKREELQRLEEKYQKKPAQSHGQTGDDSEEETSSSTDEDEDDEGFLATEDLDAQISATLQALRNKDPRVYDEKTTFYKPIEEGADTEPATKQEKPLYLRDYHRENLLAGPMEEDVSHPISIPRTFAQEQDDLKASIIKEMHAAPGDATISATPGDDDDDDFLALKPKKQQAVPTVTGPLKRSKAKVKLDIDDADNDPETFLSNFMAARAWVPGDGARFQPLESDDDEDDARAERFESAYNLRFEDPQTANETLKSYARDVVASRSVRREEIKGRKKQRDAEREKKDAEKQEREEDRARMRKLKVEEMEAKLKMIKKAAGLRSKALDVDQWSKFLEGAWDDDNWEQEMNRRFGEQYYDGHDIDSGSEDGNSPEASIKDRKKVSKPKWDDDIEIDDLVPDFVEDAEPAFSLSDSEAEMNGDNANDASDVKRAKSNKDHKVERAAKKKAARSERQRIENLVDNHLDIDDVALPTKSKSKTVFRYRDTSPTSFGLTSRDILMADDTALNQWAGLKKMATFRDAEKKRKDKRRLNKKARLRQWRKETFGNEEGPQTSHTPDEPPRDVSTKGTKVDTVGKSRRKRKPKQLTGSAI